MPNLACIRPQGASVEIGENLYLIQQKFLLFIRPHPSAAGVQTLRTQDSLDPRHFGTSAELSVRHIGTGAEVSRHFGTDSADAFGHFGTDV